MMLEHILARRLGLCRVHMVVTGDRVDAMPRPDFRGNFFDLGDNRWVVGMLGNHMVQRFGSSPNFIDLPENYRL